MRAEERIRGVLRPAGRHDRLGLRRARLLRLPTAPFALDRHPRPAGGERVREPVLRHRRPGEAAVGPLSGQLVLLLLAARADGASSRVVIKLTSPGPVFFRQRRYGLDGREIRVWKFRTMTVCEDGPAGRAGQAERSPRHPARRDPAQDVAGRTAAIVQRARGEHVAGRSAAARQRAERGVPHADRRLHAAAQGEAGHHRPGPGQRLARRNRLAGKDAKTHRIRPPLHPRMVAVDGHQDSAANPAGSDFGKECVLREIRVQKV